MTIVRIPAKTDYALRAACALAASEVALPMKGERIAQAQGIPLRFLENILGELRNAGIVDTRRGAEGGYLLARAAAEIALADIIRAVNGPLVDVGGLRPEVLEYVGPARPLRNVWVGVRGALRGLLEEVSLADVVANDLPARLEALVAEPDAWVRRI